MFAWEGWHQLNDLGFSVVQVYQGADPAAADRILAQVPWADSRDDVPDTATIWVAVPPFDPSQIGAGTAAP